MSLDAIAVPPLSNSDLALMSLGATTVSHDAVASVCAWFALYSVSEEPEPLYIVSIMFIYAYGLSTVHL